MPAGVCRNPQRFQLLVTKGMHVQQQLPQRWHCRQNADLLSPQVGDKLRGQGRALHDEGGAAAYCAEHLTHSVYKAEREDAGYAIRRHDTEITDHRLRGGEQIAMTDRYTLG